MLSWVFISNNAVAIHNKSKLHFYLYITLIGFTYHGVKTPKVFQGSSRRIEFPQGGGKASHVSTAAESTDKGIGVCVGCFIIPAAREWKQVDGSRKDLVLIHS